MNTFSSPEHIAHIISLIIYFFVVLASVDTLRHVGRDTNKHIKGIVVSFLVLAIAASLVFGLLQVLWVTSNDLTAVSGNTGKVWLIFDWANGLLYFCFVSAVRVFLKWEPRHPCADAPEACPRRLIKVSMEDARSLPKYSEQMVEKLEEVKHITHKYV